MEQHDHEIVGEGRARLGEERLVCAAHGLPACRLGVALGLGGAIALGPEVGDEHERADEQDGERRRKPPSRSCDARGTVGPGLTVHRILTGAPPLELVTASRRSASSSLECLQRPRLVLQPDTNPCRPDCGHYHGLGDGNGHGSTPSSDLHEE